MQGPCRLGSTVTKQHPLWLRFQDEGLEREFAWWHSTQMQKVLGTTPAECKQITWAIHLRCKSLNAAKDLRCMLRVMALPASYAFSSAPSAP